MVRGGRLPSQAHALSTLLNLAECSDTVQAVAREADAISACVSVLEQSSDAEVRAAAAATLACVSEAGSREGLAVATGGFGGPRRRCIAPSSPESLLVPGLASAVRPRRCQSKLQVTSSTTLDARDDW